MNVLYQVVFQVSEKGSFIKGIYELFLMGTTLTFLFEIIFYDDSRATSLHTIVPFS